MEKKESKQAARLDAYMKSAVEHMKERNTCELCGAKNINGTVGRTELDGLTVCIPCYEQESKWE